MRFEKWYYPAMWKQALASTTLLLVVFQTVSAEENRAKALAAPIGFNAINIDGESKDFLKLPGGYKDGFQKVIFEEVGPAKSPSTPDFPSNDRFGAYDDNSIVPDHRETPLLIPLPYRNETAEEKAEREREEELEKQAKRNRKRPNIVTPPPQVTPPNRIIVPNAVPNRQPLPNRPPFVFQAIEPRPFQTKGPFQIPQTGRGFTQVPPRQPFFTAPIQPPLLSNNSLSSSTSVRQQNLHLNQPLVQPFRQPSFRPDVIGQQTSSQPFSSQPFKFVSPPPARFVSQPQQVSSQQVTSQQPSFLDTSRLSTQPFRPLRPFRPTNNFQSQRTQELSQTVSISSNQRIKQSRTGTCSVTIYYKPQEATMNELQQTYSHFAVVVSVDQCARTCHEFNCAHAVLDPTNRHCQFNPGSVFTQPPVCESWPNPIYRNNVPITSRSITIKCVTCQARRRRVFRPFQQQNRAFGITQSLLNGPIMHSTLTKRIYGVTTNQNFATNNLNKLLNKEAEAEKLVQIDSSLLKNKTQTQELQILENRNKETLEENHRVVNVVDDTKKFVPDEDSTVLTTLNSMDETLKQLGAFNAHQVNSDKELTPFFDNVNSKISEKLTVNTSTSVPAINNVDNNAALQVSIPTNIVHNIGGLNIQKLGQT